MKPIKPVKALKASQKLNQEEPMYSVRLNMDTASKEKIDKANLKLRDVLKAKGEILAAERVQDLIDHQQYDENTKQHDSNIDELLKVNRQILQILDGILHKKDEGVSTASSIAMYSAGKRGRGLGNGAQADEFQYGYGGVSLGDMLLGGAETLTEALGARAIYKKAKNKIKAKRAKRAEAKKAKAEKAKAEKAKAPKEGEKAKSESKVKETPKEETKAKEVKTEEKTKIKETEKVKEQTKIAEEKPKVKTAEPKAPDAKAPKVETPKTAPKVEKVPKLKVPKVEKLDANTLKMLAKNGGTQAKLFLRNPMAKAIMAGSKFAGALSTLLLPAVGIFAWFTTADDLMLDDEDVSPEVKFKNSCEQMASFLTFGLFGEDNIWLQKNQRVEDYMPYDIRDADLNTQIDWINNFAKVRLAGTYGMDGFTPDSKTYARIMARLDTWVSMKQREQRLKDGTATEQDKQLEDQIQSRKVNYAEQDYTGTMSIMDEYNSDAKDFARYQESNEQRLLEEYKALEKDGALETHWFGKDEIKDWSKIQKLDKEHLIYMQGTNNLDRSDNLILEKLYTAEHPETVDMNAVIDDIMYSLREQLDAELELDEDSRDEDRIDELKYELLKLGERKEDLKEQNYIAPVPTEVDLSPIQDSVEDLAERQLEQQIKLSNIQEMLESKEKQDRLEYIQAAGDNKDREASTMLTPLLSVVTDSKEFSKEFNKNFEIEYQKKQEEKEREEKLKQLSQPPFKGAEPYSVVPVSMFSGDSGFSSTPSVFKSNASAQQSVAFKYNTAPVKPVKLTESQEANISIIYQYLKGVGMTDEGAAGLMGNLMAESKLYANIKQSAAPNDARSNDFAMGMNQFVNSDLDKKAITSAMLKPGFKSVGYGLAQWTTASRKAGLILKARERGTGVEDINTQLEFLKDELQGSYGKVFKVLTSTDNLKTASNVVLHSFEAPGGHDSYNKIRYEELRAAYGKQVLDKIGSLPKDGQGESSEQGEQVSAVPSDTSEGVQSVSPETAAMVESGETPANESTEQAVQIPEVNQAQENINSELANLASEEQTQVYTQSPEVQLTNSDIVKAQDEQNTQSDFGLPPEYQNMSDDEILDILDDQEEDEKFFDMQGGQRGNDAQSRSESARYREQVREAVKRRQQARSSRSQTTQVQEQKTEVPEINTDRALEQSAQLSQVMSELSVQPNIQVNVQNVQESHRVQPKEDNRPSSLRQTMVTNPNASNWNFNGGN